jgi:ankyrin repeat protein
VEIVRILLDGGADPNKADKAGHAALYHTLTSGDLGGPDDHVSDSIVKLLLDHGAITSAKGIREALTSLPDGDLRHLALQEAIDREEKGDWKTSTNNPR